MSVPEPILEQLSAATKPADGAIRLRAVTVPTRGGELSVLKAWLQLVCKMIPDIEVAYVGIDWDDDGNFRLSTVWPEGTDCDPSIGDAARYAVQGDSGIAIEPIGEASDLLARRLLLASGGGALVIKVASVQDGNRETLLRLLDWAEAWLGLVMRVPVSSDSILGDVAFDILDRGLGETTLRTSATAIAAAIATASSAARVSIGLYSDDCVELIALSHTASFDPRMQINKDIVAAMIEAIDEGKSIVFPTAETISLSATRAHERLGMGEVPTAVSTIILPAGESIVGALTLELRPGSKFDIRRQAELERLAPAVAKILMVKQTMERSVRERSMQALTDIGGRFLGSGRIASKVAALAALIGIGVMIFVNGDLQIAALATLEGRVHRIVTAPVDGYIAEAPARAGDALNAGDVLAVIDTGSLEFERRRWANEHAEFKNAHRKAIAKLDRAEATIMKARLGKATAQLALIEQQIARARVTAPFDGMVVSGDLSRSMGAPVNRGDILFEMAPLDDYRVELEVDERDIAKVVPGQHGHLALTALPGQRLPFTVDTVTGVAQASDGRNVFKVEARLDGDAPLLRPGMRGVGKITAEEGSLLWVWTHHLVDSVQLWLWARAP